MLKKLFFIILILLNFSYLYSACPNVSGTWFECYKSYSNVNCSNSIYTDIFDGILSMLVEECSPIIITQNGCSLTIKDYFHPYDQEDYDYVTLNSDNTMHFTNEENDDGINYKIDASCKIFNEKTGKCDYIYQMSFYHPNYGYITCSGDLTSDIMKVEILKDNPQSIITSDYIKKLSQEMSNKWELLGTSYNISNITEIFKNVYSVWTWNNGKWVVYSPITYIQELMNKYGLNKLTEIKAKKGFWVYFK